MISNDQRLQTCASLFLRLSQLLFQNGLRRAGQTVGVSNLPEVKSKIGRAQVDEKVRASCGDECSHCHDDDACW